MKTGQAPLPLRGAGLGRIGASCALAAALTAAVAAADAPPTVEQIVDKNVAARGGLEAWRKVKTMVWLGQLVSNTAATSVPFVMQMKRPDKMRFEVTVEGEKAIRAFDGRQGWKLKPPRGGKAELAPFTDEEVRFAKDAPGMDGSLIDFQAKGVHVELDGSDEIEGRKAYRLSVRLRSGTARHVWVDAVTFLEAGYDRESHGGAGTGTVSVYYRDYKTIEGLQIPMTVETRGADGRGADRMVINRVLVNPPLADREFAWPGGANPREGAGGAPGAGAFGSRPQPAQPAPSPAPAQ